MYGRSGGGRWPPPPPSRCVAARSFAIHPPVPTTSTVPSAAVTLDQLLQEEGDLVARFPDAFRALPLVAGAAGIVGVVANRVASGVRRCWLYHCREMGRGN